MVWASLSLITGHFSLLTMRTVEEVAAAAGEGIELVHGWTLHALEPPSPAEAEAVLREPATVVPPAAASRLGGLRIFAVPYLACGGDADFVSETPPEGESHSSLWLEGGTAAQPARRIDLFLSFYDADAHDTGFELLAALGRLLVPRLSDEEFVAYARLLERELREGASGEIDEEALEARDSGEPDYVSISLASTLAEYMHALWHDVEVRHGPEYLDEKYLKRRFELVQQIFPPNSGYTLFR